MSKEIKISGASDLVDPRLEVADALLNLAKKEVPEFNIGRVKLAKCPYCKRRPYFDADRMFSIASGVEGEAALELPVFVIRSCCSAHYAKQNEGLSKFQVLRINAQIERSQHVQARGKITAKATPVESRDAAMSTLRQDSQPGGAPAETKTS